MNRRSAGFALLVALLLAVAMPAWGQAKPAALSASDEALESSSLVPDNSSSKSGKSEQSITSSGAFNVSRVVLALAGVIGLILVLRIFVRRIIPGAAVHRGSPAVKILGRCPVSTRQNLLVIQFGKRLVLVGDAGASLNPLCEINDPEEVASILAQARDESISVAKRFESLFGRARKDFDETEEPAESFDQSHDAKPGDPALQDTQQELSDLREKVRDVARQIGRA